MKIPGDWLERIYREEGHVLLDGEGAVFEGDLLINGKEASCKSISISNAEIAGVVHFTDFTFRVEIYLSNCRFNRLEFSRCNFDGSRHLMLLGLHVSGCTIRGAVEISNCSSTNTILQLQEIKTKYIDIRNNVFGGSNLRLHSLECCRFRFTDCIAKDVDLGKTTIAELPNDRVAELKIENNKFESLSIWESDIHNCNVTGMQIVNGLAVIQSVFHSFSMTEPLSLYYASFLNGTFKERFHIGLGMHNREKTSCELKGVTISDCKFHRYARIFGNENYPAIGNIVITGEEETKSMLELNKVVIDILDLNYQNSISTLMLEDIRVHTLRMSYLENKGKLVFSGVVPWGVQPTWYIVHSGTGNWNLNNCDLRGLKKLIIKNSDLSGLRYLSVNWFSPAVLGFNLPAEESLPGREAKEAENRREAYRMLKEAAENQKDRIGSLQFQQEEMRAYEKFLKLTKPFYNPERIVLWASKSNDHGLNWWKPVVLAGICSIPFFIAIVIGGDPAISRNDLGTWAAWKQIFSHSEVFPQLLNPVHSMDKMFPGAEVHWGTWWLDYMHRLLMAFFIVQTVSAFRKYMKA